MMSQQCVTRMIVMVVWQTFAAVAAITGQEPVLERFQLQEVCTDYFSEGVSAGDLNRDGHPDVIYGPYWYAGPDFAKRHIIYPAELQNREGYANHFFAWVHDVDRDAWPDLVVVGFPGTPAHVYRNPGTAGFDQPWPKHQILDAVSNESPQLLDLVGDDTPELICTQDGFYGYATIDKEAPWGRWTFHPVSAQIADRRFGHGLGVGDLNGDGRRDLLFAGGWLEQPADPARSGGRWQLHEVAFTPAYGGAEMYGYDVDGDGDQDVITSLAAHDFGLAWFEQRPAGESPSFVRHDILGATSAENRYGVVFSELHSVRLADIDGDGLQDIVTGKTFYSHHQQSPQWDAGAVVYWFKLVRTAEGIDWLPYRIANDCGIGRQLVVQDINGDGVQDVLVGGMKGCHVLRHTREAVPLSLWEAAQPRIVPPVGTNSDQPLRSTLLQETESIARRNVTAGALATQGMAGFSGGTWSGDQQLFWTGGGPAARLTLELAVSTAGTYQLMGNFTKAPDYAIIQLAVDGQSLGEPLDLYAPDVISTGLITFPGSPLAAGPHTVTVEIVGKHPAALPRHLVGIDTLQFLPVGPPPAGSSN